MLGVRANWRPLCPTNRGHPQEAKLPGIPIVWWWWWVGPTTE